MDETTRINLKRSLIGEAIAAQRYWLFAERAEEEGYEEAAELFEDLAKEERREHAREIAALLGQPGTTRDNVRAALEGEVAEHRRLYPDFASQARRHGDLHAARRFQELGADEHRHADALRRLLAAMDEPTSTPADAVFG